MIDCRAEERNTIAMEMLKASIDVPVICKLTGLSRKQVLALKEKLREK